MCDHVGKGSTAGPISGNKVDSKAPTITIVSPGANAAYQLNGYVAASYACVDGGAGVDVCQGLVANGFPIDTTTIGIKEFSVSAKDKTGRPSTLTVTYNVVSGGGGRQTAADLELTLMRHPRSHRTGS